MKTSKQSWHYRFVKCMDWERPGNLCLYSWSVVLLILFSAACVTGVGFLFTAATDLPKGSSISSKDLPACRRPNTSA